MPKTPPAGLVLKLCREIEGINQDDLARIAGTTRLDIVRAEQGKGRLPVAFLGRLLRVPEAVTEGLRLVLEWICSAPEKASLPPLGLSLKERRAIAGEALREAAIRAHQLADARLQRHIRAHRRQARFAWLEIEGWAADRQRSFLEKAPALATWALVELLCDESERAAPSDARRCLELAELACWVAIRVEGPPAWRRRVEGYARAFLAHALLVPGDPGATEEAFDQAWELWNTGAGPGPLDEARLYNLEAARAGSRQGRPSLDEARPPHVI